MQRRNSRFWWSVTLLGLVILGGLGWFVQAKMHQRAQSLFEGVTRGDFKAVKALIEQGNNVDNPTNMNYSITGTPDQVAIKNGMRPSHTDIEEKGITPLMFAAQAGNRDTVQFLLSKGANINARSTQGRTPLSSALTSEQLDIASLLLDRGATLDRRDGTRLTFAAEVGQTNLVKFLLDRGVSINAKDQEGWTALMYACQMGHSDTVKLLLNRGADFTVRHNLTGTALHLANAGYQIGTDKKHFPTPSKVFGPPQDYAAIIALLKKAGAKD